MKEGLTWRDLEPWVQAKVRGVVLGYGANKKFISGQEAVAISPAREVEITGRRGSRTSDPTCAAAIRLEVMRSRRAAAYAEIAAVDKALDMVLKDVRNAFLRRKMTMAIFDSFSPNHRNVAQRAGIGMSERSFWRVRSCFSLHVAENLGLIEKTGFP